MSYIGTELKKDIAKELKDIKRTPIWAMLIVLLCTALTSVGQILFKIGSVKLSWNILALITNLPLMAGFFFYGIGAVLLILALKYGELSVLYPIIALGFVWVSLLSARFLPIPESMNPMKWFGVAGIIIGVTLIGYGGQNNKVKK